MEIKLRKTINHELETINVDKGITLEKLLIRIGNELPYIVLGAKVNNQIEDLCYEIKSFCTVEFLDMRTQVANLVYQHSLSLIYLKAVEDVLGRVNVDIQNSLNKGLYTEIKTKYPLTEEKLERIEKRMKDIVDENIPFIKKTISREEALELLTDTDLFEKRKILEDSKHLNRVKLYDLDGFVNFFYGIMAPSTGYIKHFELKKYRRGVLLRFPHTKNPNVIPPYVDEKKMYEAFGEAKKWQNLLDISYVNDLNEKNRNGEMREIIQLSEALHEKRIVEIAQEITDLKKRIILIAGPSSSGKTTFARRLCIQLKVNGLKPLYMGTDDYFVERYQTPLDEKGEMDFENLEAVDINLFNNNMNDLLIGKSVDLPTFDFIEGKKIYGKRITSVKRNQPIVIEGIHALNGKLTAQIEDEEKYKIYISPLTQLNIDNHNRIPTTDARMLRRLVRDYKYRGHTAQNTIRDWPKVRAGEDKNIFPYSNEADAFFNSVHIYELGVLKKCAKPLLEKVSKEESEYGEAVRMLKFLDFFDTIEKDSLIVNNSILREFIGGSIFVEQEEK